MLEQEIDDEPAAVRAPVAAGASMRRAAEEPRFLTWAKRPVIIAAEDVHWSDAAAELEALASAFTAPVYAAPYTGVLPISAQSPWYAGYLPPSLKQIAERLEQHDALLLRRRARHAHDALQRRRRCPSAKRGSAPMRACRRSTTNSSSPVSRTSRALAAITDRVARQARNAAERRVRCGRALDLPAAKARALHPTRAVAALLERFADAIWFDESGLSTSDVRQWMTLAAGEYIINGSGGIGWGLPAAVGGAIGKRDRQIVAVIGDGSALYASEALWTAGHHGTKMLLVVLANRRYATLNEAAGRLAGGALESFTIEPPVLDFSGLAKLYGWKYASAATEDELERVSVGK